MIILIMLLGNLPLWMPVNIVAPTHFNPSAHWLLLPHSLPAPSRRVPHALSVWHINPGGALGIVTTCASDALVAAY